jgi:hypothetical protein
VRNLMLGSRQTRPLARGRGVLGLAALLGLGACATSAGPLPVGSVIERARQECARLRETTLSRPVQTPVDAKLAELDQLLAAGQSDAALERARALSSACSAEAEQRSGLLVLSVDVEAIRSRVGARRFGQYRWLAEHGDYSSAIFCGQALLKGDPGGCEGAPVAARSPSENCCADRSRRCGSAPVLTYRPVRPAPVLAAPRARPARDILRRAPSILSRRLALALAAALTTSCSFALDFGFESRETRRDAAASVDAGPQIDAALVRDRGGGARARRAAGRRRPA